MSRFERKILFAIGLSVFIALGGSIFLAQGALREVYNVGVNERFGAELVHGVEARRAQAQYGGRVLKVTRKGNNYTSVETPEIRTPRMSLRA